MALKLVQLQVVNVGGHVLAGLTCVHFDSRCARLTLLCLVKGGLSLAAAARDFILIKMG